MSFDPEIGRSTRWLKGGPSPNPGGRPRSRILSEALRAKLAEIAPNDPDRRTHAEVVAANLIALACSRERNSVAAASEIADRVEGKAHMSLAFSDVTADLQARSDEELKYFLSTGHWPESDDVLASEHSSEGCETESEPSK